MKVSFFETARYLPPGGLQSDWPVPGAAYDLAGGLQAHEDMVERLRCIEEMGFDWVSFSEHHYSPRIMSPNPILTATYAAACVRKLAIAVLGPIVPQVNPIRIAEELAMLDNLSQGRLRVGMLRGTTNEMLTYGLKPEEARERTTEGMELILKAWTEPQPFGWQGRFYQFRTVSVWPRPLQQPYPPTYALGTSRETCDFAARHQLGLGASFAPYDLVCGATRYYREQCAVYGWEPASEQIVYRANIVIADTDDEAQASLHARRGSGLYPMPAAIDDALTQLDPRNVAGVATERNTNGQPTTFIGSPDTIVEQIKRCRDEMGAGVIDFFFQNAYVAGAEELSRSLELFGEKVLPRIQGV